MPIETDIRRIEGDRAAGQVDAEPTPEAGTPDAAGPPPLEVVDDLHRDGDRFLLVFTCGDLASTFEFDREPSADELTQRRALAEQQFATAPNVPVMQDRRKPT